MRKQKKEPKKKLWERFEIPEDVILDVPRVTVINNTEIRIENYKSILEYEDGKINLATKTKFITVCGASLKIIVITDDEISVSGNILSVEYS